jgi:negative regulator of flagellin synthesis FlgM
LFKEGAVPPIAVGPAGPVTCVRSVADGTARADEHLKANGKQAVADVRGSGGVSAHDLLDAGPEPVDANRVATIRKAIETGTYPLVPAAVADAFIAAGYLLRVGK